MHRLRLGERPGWLFSSAAIPRTIAAHESVGTRGKSAFLVNGVDVDRLAATIDHITADPSLANLQFRARNQWIGGGHSRTEIQDFYGAGQEDTSRERPFTVDTDEPPVLLGDNAGPNAGEHSYTHSPPASAAPSSTTPPRGIALNGREVTVTGDVDLQGFLGLDSNVRPGARRFRSTSRRPATSTTTGWQSSPASATGPAQDPLPADCRH